METSTLLNLNILIVVDTDMVMGQYEHPSKKINKPTLIDDKSVYLLSSPVQTNIVKPEIGIAKAVSGKLTVATFRGISITENANDAIIIYKINGQKGNSTLGKFTVHQTTIEKAVMPNNNTPNGLPAVYGTVNFTSIIAKMPLGAQQISVTFALYALTGDGESQELYGYYCFNTSVTIGG